MVYISNATSSIRRELEGKESTSHSNRRGVGKEGVKCDNRVGGLYRAGKHNQAKILLVIHKQTHIPNKFNMLELLRVGVFADNSSTKKLNKETHVCHSYPYGN